VEVELLGPVAVAVGDRRPRLAGRQRALLAALALRSGTAIGSGRLAEVVWGDELPADPSNALQQRVSALRRTLDPARGRDLLVTEPGGYRLVGATTDAAAFERGVARGRSHLEVGDPVAADRELGAALDRWRGPALDGFADEPWARGEATRLEELRRTATEDRIEARLALGGHDEAIARLTELIAADPLRERPRVQLMRALYRAGRQADALAAFDDARTVLAEELGIDPGPALVEVHRQVLRQDPALDPVPDPALAAPTSPSGSAAGTSPAGGSSPVPPRVRTSSTLPASSVPVVSRAADVEAVRERLAGARLVTLVGPGGAGKTTLAREVLAVGEPDEPAATVVELAPLPATASAATLTTAIARGLGLGGSPTAGSELDAVAAVLAADGRLLVLDNVEHVADALAPLVVHLLAAAPGLRILATGREALAVPGEVVRHVAPLAVPDPDADPADVLAAPAVALVLARADAAGVEVPRDRATVQALGTLVRELDGLPLALELAAARLTVRSVPELLAALEDRFGVLTSRGRGVPRRQRSLEDALGWSHALLTGPQQLAWAALAVAADRFDTTLAATLLRAAGLDHDAIELVTDLHDRSLLVVDTSTVPARLSLHASVRAYGRERLAATTHEDAVRRAHAEAVAAALRAATTADPDDPGAYPLDLDTVAAWLPDARLALAWADAAGDRRLLQQLAGGLGWLWLLQGGADEGLTWLDRGLGPVAELDPADAEPAALHLDVALRLSRPPSLELGRWAELAVAAAPDGPLRVLAGASAAAAAAIVGDLERMGHHLDAAEPTARAIGGWPLGFLRLASAQLGRIVGHRDRVREHAEEALTLLTAAGVDWARILATDLLLDDLDAEGDHERARDLAAAGLAWCRGRTVPDVEARMRTQLALAEHELGEVDRARRHVEVAVERATVAGGDTGLGYTRLAAGVLARRRGELDLARGHLEAAAGLLAGTHAGLGIAWSAAELALVAVAAEDPEVARRHAARALEVALEIGDPQALAAALEVAATARLVTADLDPSAAVAVAAWLAAADSVRRRAAVRRSSADDRDRAAVEQRLAELVGVEHLAAVRAEAFEQVGDDPVAIARQAADLGG
jgi:predicted ATPase/DNA-binding SARP family transcriptional activator